MISLFNEPIKNMRGSLRGVPQNWPKIDCCGPCFKKRIDHGDHGDHGGVMGAVSPKISAAAKYRCGVLVGFHVISKLWPTFLSPLLDSRLRGNDAS